MLKELFYKCAFEGDWQVAGKDTDYKFVEQNDTLYIFFKGSDSDYDWKTNFTFTQKVYKQFRVHKGFYKEYTDVRNIVLDKCYSKDYKRIIVVGYSLGGAICTLAIEDINYHFPNKEIVGYAFESPRVIKCKKKYKYLWDNLTIIRCNQDIVTHLPPKLFGYSDVGHMLKIKGDTKLVKGWWIPKCIKSHYPQVVLQALEKYEKETKYGS